MKVWLESALTFRGHGGTALLVLHALPACHPFQAGTYLVTLLARVTFHRWKDQMALSDMSALTILNASPTHTHLDMNLSPFVNGSKPFPLASQK